MNKIAFSIIFTILFSTSISGYAGESSVFAQTSPLGGSIADCYENEEKCFEMMEGHQESQTNELSDKKLNIGILEIFKMLAALLFVIILLYFLLRFINAKTQSYKQNQLIQNLGGTPLGGNRSIQIIKLNTSLLIVGVGDDIRVLKEITDEDEVKQLLAQYNEQLDQMMQPVHFIKKWLGKSNDASNTDKHQESFQQLLNKQLDEIKEDRKKVFHQIKEREKGQDE